MIGSQTSDFHTRPCSADSGSTFPWEASVHDINTGKARIEGKPVG
jgi:hypothetical protein